MNVASLKLCKELYELSGWEDTDSNLCLEHGNKLDYAGACWGESDLEPLHIPSLVDDFDGTAEDERVAAPAYDLGYLLRKLAEAGYYWIKYVPIENTLEKDRPFYKSGFSKAGLHVEAEGQETPEDAAAKLAIELFNQGVLTHE